MNPSICSDIKTSYGIVCRAITPINGGWMNQLWRADTDHGELLIKQFSLKRYTKAKLADIESALQRQMALKKDGIPCPHIYLCGHSAIRFLNDTTAYMVMDFQEGRKKSFASITLSQMERLPKGIAHEDFTFDNILFHENGVSCILDFDRNQYSFVWHDIGRALLCFALHEGNLRRDYVLAFLNGYNRHLPLSRRDLADALRISWCIEILWWIQPDYFTMEPCKATRFRDEILWLTKHWEELDFLLP